MRRWHLLRTGLTCLNGMTAVAVVVAAAARTVPRRGPDGILEQHAGLAAGGYLDAPLRPWAARFATALTRKPVP